MSDPAAVEDMDLEGIDVTVMFPPGSGEEWALGDAKFSAALLPDAERRVRRVRGVFARPAEARRASFPMMEPTAAAEELEHCVTQHGFVGMVTAQHILDRNLDDPSFDVVWSVAERLDVAVCVHGGGQAPGQVPSPSIASRPGWRSTGSGTRSVRCYCRAASISPSPTAWPPGSQ